MKTPRTDDVSTAQDVIYQRACEVEHELRAEVKRITHAYEYDHKCLYEVRERCELWKQRAQKAEAECLEQARLLGKGAEREADLRGKVERLERALLTNGSEKSEIKFFEKLSQKHGIKIDGRYE